MPVYKELKCSTIFCPATIIKCKVNNKNGKLTQNIKTLLVLALMISKKKI